MGRKRKKDSKVTWGNIGLTTKEDSALFKLAKKKDESVRKVVRNLIKDAIQDND